MSDLAISEVTPITRRSTPPETRPQSAGRILIIDDEAAILHALQIFLEQEGYIVTAVTKYHDYLEKTALADLPDLSFAAAAQR